MRTEKMRKFIEGYITAALWSSTDDNGEPLDSGGYSLSCEGSAKLIRFAEEFALANSDLISQAMCNRDIEYLGHDLWLTQAGHGTGFWDRKELDVPCHYSADSLGDALTDAANKFSEYTLYAGDDGLVYVS